jgi:glycosyltransferase involved in cell wall biosynthesis
MRVEELPLVSLCIPVYNGAEFIQKTIESIRQITYPNLEIIISDDDSSDRSLDLIHAANLANCQIFTHARSGLVKNWNFCISQAKGKYIKFLFQDDTIEPDCISKMVEVAERDKEIGLVFCSRKLISSLPIEEKHFPENLHLGWKNLQPIQDGLALLQDPFLLKHPHNKIGEPTNVLIRRNAFDRVGFFDPTLEQYVDLEMWFRLMSRYKIAFINEKLAAFRLHPNQTTNYNLEQNLARSEIYRVWLKLIQDPIYQVIPLSTRQKLKMNLVRQLLINYLKSLILPKWDRCNGITNLLLLTLRSKPQ